jgi:death-on-curing protein
MLKRSMILLRKVEVLEMHRRSLAEFGGLAGIRDEGAFESALVAVDNRVAYEQADVLACAATYAYHLTMAHAFVDGNKRVAAAAMRVFLLVNEVEIVATEDALYGLFIAIASGEMRCDGVEEWLRARVVSAVAT